MSIRKQVDPSSIATLRNMGAKSASWLEEVGIRTIEDLRDVGPMVAFQMVRQSRSRINTSRPSLNLLWALAAGLQDRDWRTLTEVEKDALRQALRK